MSEAGPAEGGPGTARREAIPRPEAALDRRAFVALGLGFAPLVLTALPGALVGCGREGPRCYDPELLSTPERALRATRGYADRSPRGDAESCRGCQFFRVEADGAGECGRCEILGGPVSAAGRCDAWTARTTG